MAAYEDWIPLDAEIFNKERRKITSENFNTCGILIIEFNGYMKLMAHLI